MSKDSRSKMVRLIVGPRIVDQYDRYDRLSSTTLWRYLTVTERAQFISLAALTLSSPLVSIFALLVELSDLFGFGIGVPFFLLSVALYAVSGRAGVAFELALKMKYIDQFDHDRAQLT